MGRHLADLGDLRRDRDDAGGDAARVTRADTDPNHMPVTRDLSAAKRETIVRWLEQLEPTPRRVHPGRAQPAGSRRTQAGDAKAARTRAADPPAAGRSELMLKIDSAVLDKVGQASSRRGRLDLVHQAIRSSSRHDPALLTAMMSLRPGTNRAIWWAIHDVVVDEMLHMLIGCNLLNALGARRPSTVDLVLDYPARDAARHRVRPRGRPRAVLARPRRAGVHGDRGAGAVLGLPRFPQPCRRDGVRDHGEFYRTRSPGPDRARRLSPATSPPDRGSAVVPPERLFPSVTPARRCGAHARHRGGRRHVDLADRSRRRRRPLLPIRGIQRGRHWSQAPELPRATRSAASLRLRRGRRVAPNPRTNATSDLEPQRRPGSTSTLQTRLHPPTPRPARVVNGEPEISTRRWA